MKHFIKGMTLLLAGVSFMACSKDVAFDENAQKQAEEAQKQAKIEKLYADYNAAFVKTFGAIKPGHTWGFGESATTRGVATENYGNYELPDEIKNSVGKNFANTFNPATNIVSQVTLSNYFLQHVYKQTGNGNGNTHGNEADTHHNLDQLQAYNYITGEWENVTNFTGGQNTHHMTDSNKKKMTKGVTLMVNMGTPTANHTMFRWIGDDGYECDNYIIKVINGEYYLGMGYNNDNKTDYDAWIIKIVPAVGTPEFKDRGRIMCEDLGSLNGSDFDFNDVVFDATIFNDGSINIEILAAGGTLPISVAEVPVTLGEMTNTGVNEAGTQKFTISAALAAEKGWTTLKSIPVEVTGKDGVKYELTAEFGEAPGKFCTYIGLPWADEYVNINDAYNGFSTWVSQDKPTEWWRSHMSDILTDLDLSNNP